MLSNLLLPFVYTETEKKNVCVDIICDGEAIFSSNLLFIIS
jgi:hypothetical protein